MAENLSAKTSVALELAGAVKESAPASNLELASKHIAHAMSAESISYYLSIAQETITKSISAIFTGFLILCLGLFLFILPLLNSWASNVFNTSYYSPSPREALIAQGTFVLLGLYLMVQGFVCKAQATTQTSVMSGALKLKKESV